MKDEAATPAIDPNITAYQQRLQEKLHHRYNNTPAYNGKVAYVELAFAKQPRVSVDGKEVQVEFSQLVYDKWGNRIPDLEKEYYVVTFSHGNPRLVRTRPSMDVGLYVEGGYSESAAISGSAPRKPSSAATPMLREIERQQLQPRKQGGTVLPPQDETLMPTTMQELAPEADDLVPSHLMKAPAGNSVPPTAVHGVPNWLDEAPLP